MDKHKPGKIRRGRGTISRTFTGIKGMSLPVNALIIIAIAVMALVALGAFFFSVSSGGISDTEAQRLFAVGCARYCKSELYATFQNAYDASKNDQPFIAACTKLGYAPPISKCFEACFNCNLIVTGNDLNQNYDTIVARTTRG